MLWLLSLVEIHISQHLVGIMYALMYTETEWPRLNSGVPFRDRKAFAKIKITCLMLGVPCSASCGDSW